MTAFVRNQPDSAWIAGYTPGQADFEDWDRKVAASLNGDDGGTWAPSTPIVFQNGAWGTKVVLTGPLKICYGARFTTRAGARVTAPGAQFEQLAPDHAGRNRTVVTTFVGGGAFASPPFAAKIADLCSASMQAVACGWATNPEAPRLRTPTLIHLALRVCDGATLASVTVTYQALLGTPSFRIVRIDRDGDLTPVTLTTAGADEGGYVPATPADPTLNVQSATVICDAGVVVDKSTYSYALVVREDQSFAAAPPAVLGLRARVEHVGAPVLHGSQTLGGRVVGYGDRVLTGAGIFIAAAGDWPMAPDGQGPFPVGTVIPVLHNGYTPGISDPADDPGIAHLALQVQSITKDGFKTMLFGSAKLPVAQGNIYFAAAANHTNITDTRWQ